MGLFDWMRGKRAPEARVVPEVEGPEDYEALVRVLAELSSLDLRARCRADARAVSVELECGSRRHVHVQDGWFADVEALLPVVNGWLPPGERRRLVEYREESFGAELGIAFADEAQIAELRRTGRSVLTRDAPCEGALVVDGIALEGTITFHEDGAPRRGVLAADTVIDGIPCAGGAPIELDRVVRGRRGPRGTLLAATAARPLRVGGLALPAGTRLTLYEEIARIAVATLSAPAIVAGLELPAGTELELDEEGRLYMAILGAPLEVSIEGPYRGRTLPARTILGFRDGAWDLDDLDVPEPPAAPSSSATRTLARDETAGGYALPAGSEVTTDRGELTHVRLSRPAVLDGVPCAAGLVTFSLGKLASAQLLERVTRDDIACRAHTSILLWSDGALSEATLAAPAMAAGIQLPAGARVGFYEDTGNPAVIVLPSALTIAGRACIPGQVVELDENGRVARFGHVTDEAYRHTYALHGGGPPYVDTA